MLRPKRTTPPYHAGQDTVTLDASYGSTYPPECVEEEFSEVRMTPPTVACLT